MPLIVTAIFAVTYLGMALGRLPGLRIDRTGIAVVAAVALVAAGALSQRQALGAIDACRPVPVARGNRPGARSLVRQALSDVIAGRRADRQPAHEA